MRKGKVLLGLFLLGSSLIKGQDLPPNPEPGKCYVRCVTPVVYKNVEQKVILKPAYTKVNTHPAEFETVTEKVLVKEEYKRLIVVPAVFDWESVSYQSKDASHKLAALPATFKDDSDVIEVKGATSKWEMGEKMPDCSSSDPNDCRVWCYKGYPAEYTEIPKKILNIDGHSISSDISSQNSSYKKRVVKTAAYTKEETVPAEYKTITKTVLSRDAWEEKVNIPEVSKMVAKEVLVEKGGLTVWEEVDCKLTNYNILPINYNLNSATLTATAKGIIDKLLLPVLQQSNNVSIELASHTDSRGKKESNQDLSERRAQSVVNYLVKRGINASRLVPMGYGETRLQNRCSNGVSCTEAEHRSNRRTEFRIINN